MAFLQGKRTYIFSALIIISSALFGFDLISKDAFEMMVSIFGGGAAISLRAGIKNDA